MNSILAISEQQVARTVTVRKSIELARQAYLKLARKQVIEPPRTFLTLPNGSSFYCMPAHVLGLGTVSVKVVSVNRDRGRLGLPTTSATIFVFDSRSGQEIAQIGGDLLTAIRTAASSAVATSVLARTRADTLGIIGAGVQAEAHLPAMLEARAFSRVLVYSRSKAHCAAFVRKFSKTIRIPITQAASSDAVARESDVIVLATSSTTPLFKGELVRSGSHINAIGAALPNTREMDTTLVKRAVLFVDSRRQAIESYGDIVLPLQEGEIKKSHIRAELGEIILSPTFFKRQERDITVFKAGGLGVLDATFADYVVRHRPPPG